MGQSSDAVIILVADHLDELARSVHDRLGAVAGVAVTMASAGGDPTTVGAGTNWLGRRPGAVPHRVRTLPARFAR